MLGGVDDEGSRLSLFVVCFESVKGFKANSWVFVLCPCSGWSTCMVCIVSVYWGVEHYSLSHGIGPNEDCGGEASMLLKPGS